MDLYSIQNTIYDSVGIMSTIAAGNPEANAITRIARYINLAYHQVHGKKGMRKLRRALLTFSTVANSPFVVLPQAAVRLLTLSDRVNNIPYEELTMEEIRYRDPGLKSTSATPSAYAVIGMNSAVAADPSASGQCTVVSSSATDTGATHQAYGEFITAGGYPALQAALGVPVNLNGLTPVNIGPADAIAVQKFYTGQAAVAGPSAAVGVLSLKDGAGNVIATIGPGRTMARYTRLHLFPVPSAVIPIYADVELHIENLTNQSDEPILPEDFHDVLVSGALYREYKKRNQITLYREEKAEFNQRVAELRSWINKPSGVVLNGSRGRQFSQLGPWFPNGA